jgi:hypothetical protein
VPGGPTANLAGRDGVAAAAPPVSGGEYRFAAKVGVDQIALHLVLANDGREMATYSWFSADLACRGRGYSDGEPLDGRWDKPWRAVQISTDGRFSFRSIPRAGDPRLVNISGRFVGDGRVATGIVDYRGAKGCPSLRRPFRATLYSRPNAAHPGRVSRCDRVRIGVIDEAGARDEAYGVYERDVGCTSARETARRWRASRACVALQAGGTCRVPGASCQAVRGGLFNVLVSARCTLASRPGGAVELVHYQPCAQAPKHAFDAPDALVLVWAINTDCRAVASFPLDALLGDEYSEDGPCGAILDLEKPVTCKPIGDYLCRARSDGDTSFNARCVDKRDPFKAIEITFLD